MHFSIRTRLLKTKNAADATDSTDWRSEFSICEMRGICDVLRFYRREIHSADYSLVRADGIP
jgi:hypothetical protein